MDDEQYINIEDGLSVGAIKYVDPNEVITEEEFEYIKNKTSELDERVGVVEDNIDEINSSLDRMANNIINLEDGFLSNKDINGYTKLPNGLVIQWGVTVSSGINEDAEILHSATLPINFPNRVGVIIPAVRRCLDESATSINREVIIKQVVIYTTGTFAIRLKAKDYVSGGVEVGYIAIGW